MNLKTLSVHAAFAVTVGAVAFIALSLIAPGLSANLPIMAAAVAAPALLSFGAMQLFSRKRPQPPDTPAAPAPQTKQSRQPRRQPSKRRTVAPKPSAERQPKPQAPKVAKAATPPSKFKDAGSTPTTFRIDGEDGRYIEVNAAPTGNGTVDIQVQIRGYSGSEFKRRMRDRIENVRSTTWQNPVNNSDGTRSMRGSVQADQASAALDALSRLH